MEKTREADVRNSLTYLAPQARSRRRDRRDRLGGRATCAGRDVRGRAEAGDLARREQFAVYDPSQRNYSDASWSRIVAGAAVSWRAVRSGDCNHALQALCGAAAIRLSFIFMAEVFVDPSESVFRELLLLLTMTTAICIAVCPDRFTPERS